MAEGAYWVLPHLDLFNARGLVVHGAAVGMERILYAFSYGLLYVIGMLILAGAIFRRREFR